jgi:hypothetical protein
MNQSLIKTILEFIVDTFDLKTNDTFRKVIGTVATIVALIYGIVQTTLAVLAAS